MFNYIKETIINDISNIITTDSTYDFIVKRGGNYKFANIMDKKVYKAAGVAGTKAKVTLTVSTALTAGNTYRLSMFISTPNKELADYAYPNWGEFGKVVLVEFAGKGVAADDAAALANALKLALQPDNALYKVTVATNVVTVEFAESWMHVAEVNFEAYNASTKEFEASANVTADTTTYPNVEEFATAKWIVENLRFPSYPNRRYTPLYADEAPVAGTVYNQYSFQYCVKHSVPGGLSGVGQLVDSITTHVFYVPASLASTFEGYFTTKGISVDTVNGSYPSFEVPSNAADAAAAAAANAADAAATAAQTANAVTGRYNDMQTRVSNAETEDAALKTAILDPAA